MPLHDWTEHTGWEGVHLLWITELLRWIKPRLPAGYRAYIGSAPVLAVGAPFAKPDVSVRSWEEEGVTRAEKSAVGGNASASDMEPDEEVAVATLERDATVYVERAGRLVAALELISPRNKDRVQARAASLARYAGYLLDGANLLLIDVHARPVGFSFADAIASSLEMQQPALPSPMAASYRVGETAPEGGRLLALWRRSLRVNQRLPELPLPITVEHSVVVDLEATYARAASDAYLA